MTSQACTQTRKYPVDIIWHADWSMSAKGRWVAKANRTGHGWQINAIEPVGELDAFRASLRELGRTQKVWLGLDMPIGFASTWFDGANVKDFNVLLGLLSTDAWQDFFDVCRLPEEITHQRPFYPKSSGKKGSVKRDHLIQALGLSTFGDLHRRCELPTHARTAACPPFWTLGANQVGKAMLHGLQNLILPGFRDGFNIWPYSGDLAACASQSGVTLIETYPGEIYGWLGLSKLTKSSQSSRADAIRFLLEHPDNTGIEIADEVRYVIQDGIDRAHGKDDAFDALIGIFGLIRIAAGKHAENLPRRASILEREGWIVGMDETTIRAK
ncbi:MAG: hypothetical protein ACFHHU_16430 [Porticoccaceae bacterium]